MSRLALSPSLSEQSAGSSRLGGRVLACQASLMVPKSAVVGITHPPIETHFIGSKAAGRWPILRASQIFTCLKASGPSRTETHHDISPRTSDPVTCCKAAREKNRLKHQESHGVG